MAEFNSYAPGSPSWVELATTDAAGAKKFYGAVFDWTFADEPAGESGIYTTCLLGGKPVAGLFAMGEAQRASGVPPHWATYITVADIDETASKVADAGGTIFMGPTDVMNAGRRIIVRDTEGAFVSFWEPKEHVGSRLANEPGSFTWNELQVHDMDRAAAFYESVLDVTSQTAQMPSGPYTIFSVRDHPVAGMMAIREEWGPVPPHWDVYFAVADPDETADRANSAGGSVHVAPTDIPDVGRFAGITDPQGAMFYIISSD